MVYVTGDMHGDISSFKRKKLQQLKKNDTLIVCGDFGFVFDGSKREQRLCKWIGKRKYNVLFVDGVHDNYNLIEQFKKEEWNGGLTHHISGRLRHLCRGEIFGIENLKIFAFGGGEPWHMDNHLEWGEKLRPTAQELQNAKDNLAKNNNKVDFIITHQCSGKLKQLLTVSDSDINLLDTFFDDLRKDIAYTGWFFGGIHIDKYIPPREACLYEEVILLGESMAFKNSKHTKHRKIRLTLKR